ncbi:MAG: hypothetical protein FWE27_04785 [Defluviitaleaceae bacterium]|nr:hypothetical protein [Defluviitaleaceae bacterium]
MIFLKLLHGFPIRFRCYKKADKIIVLKNGRIETTGTRDERISRDGLYAHMTEINMYA